MLSWSPPTNMSSSYTDFQGPPIVSHFGWFSILTLAHKEKAFFTKKKALFLYSIFASFLQTPLSC